MKLRAYCIAAIVAFVGVARADKPAPPPTAMSDWDPALLAAAGVDGNLLHCTRDNRWGALLKDDARAGVADMMAVVRPSLAPGADTAAMEKKLESLLFWRMVRAVLLEGDNNNLGVLPLKGRTWVGSDGKSHAVVIFRSGITPKPGAEGSCFTSLLDGGHVRHVVNLFDGDIPVGDLVAAEQHSAVAAGATYVTASDDPAGYGPWRDTLRKKYDDPALRMGAMRAVARLVREQILAPGGKPPTGNIHIHCGGGMHRSGMVAGVVEKCVDGFPAALVEAHYLFHVGYKDREHPGGAEDGNLRFLRDFDCALLDGAK